MTPGLESPVDLVKICASEGADGILVTPGVLEQSSEEVGDLAILLRLDGGISTIGPSGPLRILCSAEGALLLGADCGVVSAAVGTDYESADLEKVGRMACDGRRLGLPLMAQIRSKRMLPNHMDYTSQGSAEMPADIAPDVSMACRIGVELGADVVETRYPGDVEAFRTIVASSGKPVVVSGGPLRESGLEPTLRIIDDLLEAGAAGVVFGRRIWQQPDPAAALRAVCALVHDDATVEEALEVGR